ncbi:MAG: NADH-quinone oxidoreductase subunit NuoE [Ignavibacteria bacterium]|jgi:NADH-quinone oxidoreductase subunit E|nr:NADH-quinone oxidoreductase subunit NuoE [Ignavibacteria bacterium]MCU7498459.1 NADH-quinone oxidoreductase subunit NuoE [Ignavibacteria bacterium]MCU7512643.1 NADH-quinone oxidoreductase subunit NuoE [Ignavibacteria bacterium]MCU7521251.1 NADH-quinone oxidoreductase subunit NuoE [Ignavibacteria bacterium]MCU7526012.1 NADH-quinone oxidoreductase subunit NuoE [Ignavibacteria bacterium]
MLSEEERKEIEEEFKLYPHKQAAAIEAMKVVQKHRGWLSDESMQDLARMLEISVEDLDGVATFYNLLYRSPVGRHIILVCNSISCYILGYNEIYQALSNVLGIRFGETSPDGRFTLLPVPCLGTCDHAPAMMIDKDLHRDLTPETIGKILEAYK